VERRRKSTAPQPIGGINQDAATNVPTNSLPELPYIEETIEHGGISIGVIPPLTTYRTTIKSGLAQYPSPGMRNEM
jgi:hypothetical protein